MNARILLTTVYRPFAVDDPLDSPDNGAQHDSCHRQFTRHQGAFGIQQQCSHLGLHLIAANLDAEVLVVEYPSLEELEGLLSEARAQGRPWDWVGVTAPASYVGKAQRICQRVAALSPGTRTVLGGAGALAVGELIERFSDEVCCGDGVAFFRRLLGQDPDAPLWHPPVPAVHRPNRILGCGANPLSFSLAVSLGCERACPFCSTSAQFAHQRIRVLPRPEDVIEAMRTAERSVRDSGRCPSQLHFVIFDENFLSDEGYARGFLELNQRQLVSGVPYLPLLFTDARNLRRFSCKELLRMGVDAVWVGLESRDGGGYHKNDGVSFKALVDDLHAHGIKTIVSLIAGRLDQSAEEMRKDAEFALTLGATAFQYAPAIPMPGTVSRQQALARGQVTPGRREHLNMFHFVLRHPELSAEQVLGHIKDFHERDFERHGPLALRYMKVRLGAYLRFRDSEDPALRARARGFRNEVMGGIGMLSVGPILSPNEEIARSCAETMERVRQAIRLRELLPDLLRGRVELRTVAQQLLFGLRVLEPVGRYGVLYRALRADPRSRERCATLWGLVRHARSCIEDIRRGEQPWDQPDLVLRRYGVQDEAPRPGRLRRALGRLWRRVKPAP